MSEPDCPGLNKAEAGLPNQRGYDRFRRSGTVWGGKHTPAAAGLLSFLLYQDDIIPRAEQAFTALTKKPPGPGREFIKGVVTNFCLMVGGEGLEPPTYSV